MFPPVAPEDQDGGINVVKTWMKYILQTLIPAKHLARKSEQITTANPSPRTYYKCQALRLREKK